MQSELSGGGTTQILLQVTESQPGSLGDTPGRWCCSLDRQSGSLDHWSGRLDHRVAAFIVRGQQGLSGGSLIYQVEARIMK